MSGADQPRIGDRVRFVKPTALLRGWPYRKTGTVIEQPYQGVWYVRVDVVRTPRCRSPPTWWWC
jgi:hypothetical protein